MRNYRCEACGEFDGREDAEREIVLLAEMIAAGERDKALDALHDLHPDVFLPATIKGLVARRQARAEALF